MNILDFVALVDWVTPTISGAKQVTNGMVTWPCYQGSGRDLELATDALKAAKISYKHHTFARALLVHPDDMGNADKALWDAGFEVKNTGFIKRK